MYDPGGSHIDMVYVYEPALWGAISRNLMYSDHSSMGQTKLETL